MRRFEFSEGKSNKFWEIEVEGSGYTTRHGRIGSDGRATSKTFASPAVAQKQAEAQMAQAKAELDAAQANAKRMVEEAMARAERQAAEAVRAADEKAKAELQKARETIAAEKRQALQEIRQEVVHLTIAATGQLLQQKIDDQQNRQLVEKFVADAGSRSHG